MATSETASCEELEKETKATVAISSPLAEGPGCLYSCPTCNTEQLGNGSSQFVDDFPIAKKPPFSLGMFGISQPRLITKGYQRLVLLIIFANGWMLVTLAKALSEGRRRGRRPEGRRRLSVLSGLSALSELSEPVLSGCNRREPDSQTLRAGATEMRHF